jgi:hypothetical protein
VWRQAWAFMRHGFTPNNFRNQSVSFCRKPSKIADAAGVVK